MSLNRMVLAAALTAFACASGLRAQEAHQHQHGAEELGRVSFPISCSAEAQKQFNRAAAWLHSFGYEEADKAFEAVTVVDPKCGMAYWGIA
ncbi:MAG TPA: hypothetical protein VK747_13875, partial [Blastocatellia bacterium]|nr:hypothetical protein [Blastocatellia bacterium]